MMTLIAINSGGNDLSYQTDLIAGLCGL